MELTSQTKIFVGCLPSETIESELFDYFSFFCGVSNLKIKYRSNSICAGYGHFICLNPSPEILNELFSTPHFY
jgi:hypothetical protein